MGLGRYGFVLVAAVACVLSIAAPAEATFPGANGKMAGTIVFATDEGVDDIDLFTVNPDGANLQYHGSAGFDTSPAWSPDSSKIAFSTNRDGNWEIYVMNPNGSGQTRLTANSASEDDPAWSPDGTRITFVTSRDGNQEIYTMNADGTGQARLTNNPAREFDPEWSPDGTKVAFVSDRDGNPEIYSMNADGTGATRLTNDSGYDLDPSWSPDDSKIAYSHQGTGPGDIYVMNRDGSNSQPVTSDGSHYATPAWSPDGTKMAAWQSDIVSGEIRVVAMNTDGTGVVPIFTSARGDDFGYPVDWGPVVSGYARPKGASPFQAYLVPAYSPCTAPNRTHGAPLAFPSCNPPTQSSGQLTVGSPDANGKAANSRASVIYTTRTGDAKLDVAITDVRKRSDLSDYTGQLRVVSEVRITDRNNTPNPGGPGPGTVSDTSLPATVPCTPTADTMIGSACSLSTTVNALYPGAITGGERSVWALGQVRAYDAADDTLFMVQGLFVP